MIFPSRISIYFLIFSSICALAGPISGAGETPSLAAGLVLHYDFSDDTPYVIDQSKNNYNGKKKNVQWLPEFEGCRGVLRFNGKNSGLFPPSVTDAPKLEIKGDMTLFLRARLNQHYDQLQRTVCIFGDGGQKTSFYLGIWKKYNLNFTYWFGDKAQAPYLTQKIRSENMTYPLSLKLLPMDNWADITIVAAYPRLRVYLNARKIHDFQLPVPGVVPTSKIKAIGCAPSGDWNAPIDLDEVRLYDRALSENEIGSLSGIINKNYSTDNDSLSIAPLWYEKKIQLCISADHLDTTSYADLNIQGLSGGNITRKDLQLHEITTDSLKNDKRLITEIKIPFSLSDINKKLNIQANIYKPDHTLIKTLKKQFTIIKPDWVFNGLGEGEQIPTPWTPVTIHRNAKDIELGVLDRIYQFGHDSFIRQIFSQGQKLLSSPTRFITKINNREIEWKHDHLQIKEQKKNAVKLTQLFKCPEAEMILDTHLEYDGYAIIDVTIKANKNIKMNQFHFELPLNAASVPFCYAERVYPDNIERPMDMCHWGKYDKDLSFKFGPTVWLGDDLRGIIWQAESDEFWRNAEQYKAMQVIRGAKEVTFRTRLIDPEKTLDMKSGQKIHFKFALQATPIKPLRQSAFEYRIARVDPPCADHDLYKRTIDQNGTKMLDVCRKYGIKQLYTNIWTDWPDPMPKNNPGLTKDALKSAEAIHARDMKFHNYAIHQRHPVSVPEIDNNLSYISKRPWQMYTIEPVQMKNGQPYNIDSQISLFTCSKSQAWADMVIFSLNEKYKKFGDDGVYLDGTSHLVPCTNELHGCGYTVPGTNKRKPTYPVFSVRKLMQRIYTITKQYNPSNIVDLHSYMYNPTAIGYADLIWSGEQWWHRKGKKTKYPSDELPLDMFRTAFTGRQLGVGAEFITYRISFHNYIRCMGIPLLHDVGIRLRTSSMLKGDSLNPNTPFEKIPRFPLIVSMWKMRDNFDIKNARIHYYYENEDLVKLNHKNCHATLFVHKTNGILAIVSNLSHQDHDLSLTFNFEKTGYHSKDLRLWSFIKNQEKNWLKNNQVSLHLNSHEWDYIWLKPKNIK